MMVEVMGVVLAVCSIRASLLACVYDHVMMVRSRRSHWRLCV